MRIASTYSPLGLANDLRLHAGGVVGSGLELDGELIRLAAFTSRG